MNSPDDVSRSPRVLRYEPTMLANAAARRIIEVIDDTRRDPHGKQSPAYRERVLPPAVKHRIAIEAAHPMSWYRWVGDGGEVIGLERFGSSAPYQRIYQELGLTSDHVVNRVRAMFARGDS